MEVSLIYRPRRRILSSFAAGILFILLKLIFKMSTSFLRSDRNGSNFIVQVIEEIVYVHRNCFVSVHYKRGFCHCTRKNSRIRDRWTGSRKVSQSVRHTNIPLSVRKTNNLIFRHSMYEVDANKSSVSGSFKRPSYFSLIAEPN